MSSSIHDTNVIAPSVDADKETILIDLASSSPPASVAASNDGNTAGGSVFSHEAFTYTTVVPYTGPFGPACTEDTLPKDVSDWCVYLSFCENGPTITIECIDTVNDDGTQAQFNKMTLSKKLLCDHSKYFKALYRHGFTEGVKGVVQFVDILLEEMMRLKMFLISGNPTGRISIGRLEAEMSNLVRTYELADRLQMPEIMERIVSHTNDLIVSHRNWGVTYQQEVLLAPAASTITTATENFHREVLLDICKAHALLSKMLPPARVLHPDQLVTLIAECCHPKLLRSMTRHMNKDLRCAILDADLDKKCA